MRYSEEERVEEIKRDKFVYKWIKPRKLRNRFICAIITLLITCIPLMIFVPILFIIVNNRLDDAIPGFCFVSLIVILGTSSYGFDIANDKFPTDNIYIWQRYNKEILKDYENTK
jgi:hypothetical protein